jgi:hypothetical protein
MTARAALLLLLAAAGCASSRPVSSRPLQDLPPLPRSSLMALLAHRSDLDLSDQQVAALEEADAELQQRLLRLRAEGAVAPRPPGGLKGGLHGGGGMPSSGPSGGGTPMPGFGMNMGGPDGFQLSPNAGGAGGGRHGGGDPGGRETPPASDQAAATPRRDPVKAQEALDARLDDADTAAFLGIEPSLTAAQRDRAREIATSYREQLFERRELTRGR